MKELSYPRLRRSEIIKVKNKKQRPIKDFFKERNILLEISYLLLFLVFVDLDIVLERQCYCTLNFHHFSFFIVWDDSANH